MHQMIINDHRLPSMIARCRTPSYINGNQWSQRVMHQYHQRTTTSVNDHPCTPMAIRRLCLAVAIVAALYISVSSGRAQLRAVLAVFVSSLPALSARLDGRRSSSFMPAHWEHARVSECATVRSGQESLLGARAGRISDCCYDRHRLSNFSRNG